LEDTSAAAPAAPTAAAGAGAAAEKGPAAAPVNGATAAKTAAAMRLLAAWHCSNNQEYVSVNHMME
jgi:hypothetical protein